MQMTNRPTDRKTKLTHIDKQITAERDKRQRVEEGGGGGEGTEHVYTHDCI